MIPGEYILKSDDINANGGRKTIQISVVNTGDRPVQIGSHYHFFEVNKEMSFDRTASFGMRLNIPAGTAVRFEPGERKKIELVDFGGNKIIYGFNDLTNGTINEENKKAAIKKMISKNFKNETL